VHLAHHDALTGLGNRLLFHKELRDAVAHRRRHGSNLAVLYIDLDGFKTIMNARHGQRCRAQALGLRCRMFSGKVTRSGALVATSSRSFSAAMRQQAIALATRLIELLKVPFSIGLPQLAIGASMELFVGTTTYQDPTQLLRARTRRCTREGGMVAAGFGFSSRSSTGQVQNVAISRSPSAQLSTGMGSRSTTNPGKFGTGQISGFEALSRWKIRNAVFVPSGYLHPLAEEIGLIAHRRAGSPARLCGGRDLPEHITVA